MKNLTQTLLGLLLLLIGSNLQAQTTSDTPFLKLLAQPNAQADTMLLRWVVSDPTTWKDGVAKGYTLTRFTTHINGTPLSGTAIRDSVVELSNTLYPLSESTWDSQFPNNNFAKVAKGTLYETDSSTVISNPDAPKLADAVNTQTSEEARFLFALFAAEQDFEVAKGMALAYCDATVQAGHTYIYRLSINGTELSTAISIAADNNLALPPIDSITAEGMDRAIALEWNTVNTEEYYSSYSVERSTDGVNFSSLSKLPFIFASDSEADPTTAVFRDSIPSNNTSYYYRVCGRTPFGTKGPPSPVVEAQGIPPRITPFFISIDSQQIGQNEVILHWETFDDALEPQMQGFNLYRSENTTSAFEPVNDNIIAASNRSFTDSDPLPVGYYILEAVDENNYGYESSAVLVQLPDSIPPAIPTGLTGQFVSSDRVQLTWQANTEADFKGYRLFVANAKASNYIQITPQPVATEQFVYEIEPNFIVDSIYFKILSTDQRDNYSEKSACFALRRPDIVPPSTPVLQKVNPTPAGIELGWKFSSSTDVAYHILERKPINAPGWATVLKIAKTEETQYQENLAPESIAATCFIDTTNLARRGYEYRFKAYDQDNNRSSSEVIAVRPFDNGQRGIIENFAAKAECLPVGTIDKQEGYDVLARILDEYQYGGIINQDSLLKLTMWQIISNEEYELLKEQDPYEAKVFLDKRKLEIWEGSIVAQVNLAWGYAEQEQLKDFQIYRSAEGSPIMLYKTLPLEIMTGYGFLDEDVQPNRRYYYQIIARHADGGFSEKSRTLMVKVPKF